ncbi:hypothetical protein TSUD_218950 [Trifolium subterraneum]|uniref:Replication factor A C-terminal domain-containing protein n=1 Tax=Trifolium subterraneum TaxID=3900 RepID=A0A2Z6MJ48_TRISU|nr:hypothetical protein TSUD_218950 [Trifolium subterraneum]
MAFRIDFSSDIVPGRTTWLFRVVSIEMVLVDAKTRLELAEGPKISRYGLSLTTISEVCAQPPDYDYLGGVLALHGIEGATRVNVFGPRVRPFVEEDFLHTYPLMSVSSLNSLVEDGTFVVCATIFGLVYEEDWWYPACKCQKSVTPNSGAYYCGRCVKHVFHMIPRYRVKLRVTDRTGDVVFVVFDGDMQYLLASVGAYPAEILRFEGSKLLFKVARVNFAGLLSDGSFRVKRVCSDPDILKCFDVLGSKDVVSTVVVEPDLLCEDQLSGGYPSLSEAGVDELVSGLLVSPAESFVDQVGLSGLGSLDKLVAKSLSKSKRNLTAAFVEFGESVGGSSPKANRVE